MFLYVLAGLIFVAWVYAIFIRPKLIESNPEFGKFAEWEATLYSKSRTMLAARVTWLGGALVGLHEMASQAGLDVTPITDQIGNYIPEQYRGLALAIFVYLLGMMFAKLRKLTDTPLPDANAVEPKDG